MNNPLQEAAVDEPECPKCGQRAWRIYLGKRACVCCSHKPETSYGMLAPSVHRLNHPDHDYKE